MAILFAPSESTLSVYSGLDEIQADITDAGNTSEREDLGSNWYKFKKFVAGNVLKELFNGAGYVMMLWRLIYHL